MGEGGSVGASSKKIKGGKWTVFRFFLVSIAHSIGWFTVSSLLGHYALLYGPQILLFMNIFYYLPSIPLLLFSAFCDDWLDRTFGVPRVILARLLFGLGGCALVCALFPFVVFTARDLLAAIVVLGLVSAIAFSASYQLVARFANKNVVSLGLGCVGSGLVVLVLEMAVHMRSHPTQTQLVILFELTAVCILLGFMASASLLARHWAAIESWSAEEPTEAQADLEEPLHPQMQAQHLESMGEGEEVAQNGEAALEGSWHGLERRRSTPLLLNYAPLDFFEALSEGHAFNGQAITLSGGPGSRSSSLDIARGRSRRNSSAGFVRAATEPPTIIEGQPLHLPAEESTEDSAPGRVSQLLGEAHSSSSVQAAKAAPLASPFGGEAEPWEKAMEAGPEASEQEGDSGAGALGQVAVQCWPVLGAIFFSGTFFVLAFPFFPYVPSDGTFGQELPRVLFFSRLLADVCGRTIPRVKRLAVHSRMTLFGLGCFMTASIPAYLYYIKASPWHSDWAITGYIVVMWVIGGMVNTCSYVVAPTLVEPHHKAAANGLLAITYQTAHCTGLVAAIAIAALVFGRL